MCLKRFIHMAILCCGAGVVHAEMPLALWPADSQNVGQLCPPPVQAQPLPLYQAVELALCHSPQTRQAWLQVKSRAAQVGVARSAYYPTLKASAQYEQGETDYTNLGINNKTTQQEMALQFNWLLYDFGARSHSYQQARFMLEASLAQHHVVIQQKIMETVAAFYEVSRFESLLGVQQDLLAISHKNMDIAQSRYQNGVGVLSDALQAEANYQKALSDQIGMEGNLDVAKNNLSLLMGKDIQQSFLLKSIIVDNEHAALADINSLLEQARTRHPGLLAIDQQIKAQEQAVQAVGKQAYPNVMLFSSYRNSRQTGDLYAGSKINDMAIGVRMDWPLFDGFANSYQTKVARANLTELSAQKDQLLYEVSYGILKSYRQLQAETKSLQALKVLQRSASQSFQVISGRYREGVGSISDVLASQGLLSDANARYNESLLRWLNLRCQLMQNIGTLNMTTVQTLSR